MKAGESLFAWRYAVGQRGLAVEWVSLSIEKVTAKRVVLAPPDPKRTTRRIMLDRARLESTGEVYTRALGAWGHPYAFTVAGRVVEEARLVQSFRSAEEFRRLMDENRGRPYWQWRSLADIDSSDPRAWPSTPAEIKKKFRSLALTMHPDRGGDHGAFVALNASYQRALAMAGGV